MKQFLLFAGDIYYPDGGWADFKGDFETIEAALKELVIYDSSYDNTTIDYVEWAHIIDTETMKCVYMAGDSWAMEAFINDEK